MRSSDPYAERRSALDRPGQHWLSTLQALDCNTYLPLDILTKVDRMSMAHSLEVRPPLLDHKLAELVATIPAHLLFGEGQTKRIFKSAMKELVPSAVLGRPKQGFAVPLDHWFRGEVNSCVRDILFSDRARSRGIFRPDQVEKLLKMHSAGRNMDLHLWTLISFEMWCRLFIDRAPRAAVEHPSELKPRETVAVA
jgi:asparagine synthase (glutamine-hydrolysing)